MNVLHLFLWQWEEEQKLLLELQGIFRSSNRDSQRGYPVFEMKDKEGSQ
jgi:hypothetical protein